MEETRLRYLYQRFNERTASDAEVEEFYMALSDPAAEKLIKSIIEDTWDDMSALKTSEVPEHRAKEIYALITEEMAQVAKVQKLWPRIVAVAAMVTMVVFGAWFYNSKYLVFSSKTASEMYANDIAPGSVGATLTLANGKKIRLSDAMNGELAQEAGVKITKTADGQLIYEIVASRSAPRNEGLGSSSRGTGGSLAETKTNVLSTAKGETYQVRLPDGSLVYLNAASILSYPSSFGDVKERRVKLSGEGYFEIYKDKARPFIVESKGQQVEVLGTHFNICAYADAEDVKTTLLEGSVQVSSSIGKTKTILKPGQQAINSGHVIDVKQVETEDAIAWKNGYFMFNNEELEGIMAKIGRWYNVEIRFDDPKLKKELFFGTISRYENINKVLKLLKRTDVVRFELEGNVLHVKKK